MIAPEYVIPIINTFLATASKTEVKAMKKYMKNKFEFFGIKSPKRKEIYKLHKSVYGLFPESEFENIVRWCWGQPQREFQYFAMEFLGRRVKKANIDIINLYEFMIANKSWWDTVDYIAANLLGDYFKKFPQQIKVVTTKWMSSEDIWLQRSCLLFQLKYKQNTDEILMAGFINELFGSKEFFINKAIGWVLREYSKTSPGFVVEFVSKNHLSGLSRREALKWMQSRELV